jgi:hypothetical protein
MRGNIAPKKTRVYIQGEVGGQPVYLTKSLKWSAARSARGLISFERACEVMDEIFYHGRYDDVFVNSVDFTLSRV